MMVQLCIQLDSYIRIYIIAQRVEYISVIIVTFVCTCMPTLLAGTECGMEHAIIQEK